ncbi:MAG TPA: hypothetical protein VGN49_13020 [Micrococcaceae bacterium]|jgi:hypothetical protein|nr:hypothetical protein [Micrococcaceae bacterium]
MSEQEAGNRSMDATEADYLEQQLPANPAEDDTADPEAGGPAPEMDLVEVEANEADVLEQRREVPDDDDYQDGASSGPAANY